MESDNGLALMVQELKDQTCMYSNSTSFIRGFMLGQLSVLIVIVLALRYLLMEDVKKVRKVCKPREHGVFSCSLKSYGRGTFLLDCQRIRLHVLLLLQHNFQQRISAKRPIMTWYIIHQRAQTGSMCCWLNSLCNIVKMQRSMTGLFWLLMKFLMVEYDLALW